MYGAERFPMTCEYSRFSITITITCEDALGARSRAAGRASGCPGLALPHAVAATASMSPRLATPPPMTRRRLDMADSLGGAPNMAPVNRSARLLLLAAVAAASSCGASHRSGSSASSQPGPAHAGVHARAAGPRSRSRSTRASAHADPPSASAGDQAAAVRRLLPQGLPVYCGGTQGRYVAFTFDDGPGPYTHLALRKLRAHRERATFFLVGKELATQPASLVRQATQVGTVGDHTWTHP